MSGIATKTQAPRNKRGSRWYNAARQLLAGIGMATVLGFGISSPVAAAGSTLENITYSSLPGNKVQVKLTLSGEVKKPSSFVIDDPARLALDFPDTGVNLATRTVGIGVGSARSVTAVEAGGRTRVVMTLVRQVPYNLEINGQDVIVTLDSGTSATTDMETSKAILGTGKSVHSVSNVDFRRGDQGEGRVLVTLSDTRTVADVREEGGQIVVDFYDTSLPGKLERTLDVVDFATAVKSVDTFAKGNNVRLVITPGLADYEHLAYQSENVLTIDVKQISKEKREAAKKKKFGYVGEKLSLNFQNIEVRAVLQLIADFTGLNLVTSDTVQGNVTLRLKNVPWDQALDIVLKTKGLAKRKMGNVLLVAPSEEIAAREKLELEAAKQIEELAPLRSEYIQINYAKAVDLADLMKNADNNLLTPGRGNVTVDERTNTLLIQDTADRLSDIRRLVATLDIPVRQVLIESRIVVANDDFSKDLGVRFGGINYNRDEEKDPIVTGNLNGIVDLINNDPVNLIDSLNVNLPATPSAAIPATIGLALAKLPFGTLLELELSAMQQEGRGELISNPRVITANQKKAYIEQGTEIPYLEASSSGAATISFKKAVLRLEVTPHITPDDRVIMDLLINQDTLGILVQLFSSVIPSIDTQEVNTQVLVDNGETVVLGGIYQQESVNNLNRVPLLGDLPYLGFLFRQKSDSDEKQELLIFVTPKIIKDALTLN